MDEFKITLFEKEHKLHFPNFRLLTGKECENLESRIRIKYNFVSNTESEIFSRQHFFNEDSATENFKLLNILNHIGINNLQTIYINWNDFSKVDSMDVNTLGNYFYDIWFPIADDIDVFDDSLDWILTIRHDGAIYYMK